MTPTRAVVSDWITQYLVNEIEVPPDQIEPDRPFSELGFDSLEQALMLGMMEEEYGFEIDIQIVELSITRLVDQLVAVGLVQTP